MIYNFVLGQQGKQPQSYCKTIVVNVLSKQPVQSIWSDLLQDHD